MKKLLLIGLTLILTLAVWTMQHARRQSVLLENEVAARALAELQSRAEAAESGRQTAEQSALNLRSQIAARPVAVVEKHPATTAQPNPAVIQPDPTRQGGWPANAAYFYLPKQCLTNANYKLLAGHQLTDEAAALLGLSPDERSRVNAMFTGMFNQFRDLESQAMKPIAPPEPWAGFSLGSGTTQKVIAYQIPSLAADIEPIRQGLSQQLEQTLGSSRAQLVGQAADAQLRQELDDLGAGDRTIGFVPVTEQDGSYTLWYAVADARHGEGSFQLVPDDVDANSQIAYYATMFNVKLPGK